MITLTDMVEREVIYCATTLVFRFAEQEIDEWAHLFHGFDKDAALDQLHVVHEPMPDEPTLDDIHEAMEACGWDASDFAYQKVYEHWIVSDWLAIRLEKHGEVIERDFYGLTIWGRGATGQRISLDPVIQNVYDEWKTLAV